HTLRTGTWKKIGSSGHDVSSYASMVAPLSASGSSVGGPTTDIAPLIPFLASRDIGLVLDIGAGSGAFAAGLRRCGYAQRIVSMEPMRERYATLRSGAWADPAWETVQCAMGDKDGIIELEGPQEQRRETEDVVMSRISTLLPAFRTGQEPVLVRINVPGRELEILHGARTVMEHIAAFHFHVSLQSDPSGISALDDLTRTMQSVSYECVAITPGAMDLSTGTMRHAGVTFARPATVMPA
ncbi:MAG: FkbM family methyltransferase, partial [Candidatus Kapaibacterium sp.]